MKKHLQTIITNFSKPLLILAGIFVYLYLDVSGFGTASFIFVLLLILFGSYELVIEIVDSLMKRKFALDYIALCAILVSVFSDQLLVGAVIALMLSTGQHLEKFAAQQAKKSLTALVDRIPNDVMLIENGVTRKVKIHEIEVGQEILIRKGEVIPLDGVLVSVTALTDESSLTGEPYLYDKFTGDIMRSGTVNIGDIVTIRVSRKGVDSTYNKIIAMVKNAQEEKAPLIRMADKYSTFFTIITFSICLLTFLFTHDWTRVLSILVIATPCPLILAAPIALLGGVNACAKKRIIAKRLSSLEVLSRINTVIFDKTGTITIGKPKISMIEILDNGFHEREILALAAAVERNSLHPLAKAIVEESKSREVPLYHAQNVKEVIGNGIHGEIEGKIYKLNKAKDRDSMAILFLQQTADGDKKIAIFHFDDQIKQDTVSTLEEMKKFGLETYMFTGDKQIAAERVVRQLGIDIHLKAECTPQDKQDGIKALKKAGKVTAMIGDGINDAPALALADIGMVFSNEEQTASSEAADMIFLGGDFNLVLHSIQIARRTIKIAMQSIVFGIGLSILGMVFAAFGFIIPFFGAVIQELIDVSVILNALRASKSR